MHINRKRTIYILSAIIILSFGLRLSRCFLVDRFDKDCVLYITIADHFSKGEIRTGCSLRPEMPALFPYLMSLTSKILHIGTATAGNLLNILFGTLSVFFIFLIINLVFSYKVTLLITVLCGFNPLLIDNSTGVMREQTAFCLMLVALFFILKGIKSEHLKPALWIASGIASAFASFIRPDGLELIPVCFLWLLTSFIFFKNERTKIHRKLIPAFIIMIISFFIVVYPIQNYFNKNGSIYTVIPNSKTLRIYLGI